MKYSRSNCESNLGDRVNFYVLPGIFEGDYIVLGQMWLEHQRTFLNNGRRQNETADKRRDEKTRRYDQITLDPVPIFFFIIFFSSRAI